MDPVTIGGIVTAVAGLATLIIRRTPKSDPLLRRAKWHERQRRKRMKDLERMARYIERRAKRASPVERERMLDDAHKLRTEAQSLASEPTDLGGAE